MIVPPIIEDLGDPGSWQDALRWVRSPVINFNPADNEGRQFPDGPGSVASDRSFHSTACS